MCSGGFLVLGEAIVGVIKRCLVSVAEPSRTKPNQVSIIHLFRIKKNRGGVVICYETLFNFDPLKKMNF